MKKEWPKLATPPITEAVIEIRFSPNEHVTLDHLKTFAEATKSRYPKRAPLYVMSGQFGVSPEGDAKARSTAQAVGLRLTNVEGNRTCMARIDYISVSFLPPYTPWPALAEAAHETYDKYRKIVPQEQVIRVGMRYVNRLNLPLIEGQDILELITTEPRFPKGIPELLSGFETTVYLPLETNSGAIVRQRLEPPSSPDQKGVPFVLDIDAFFQTEKGIDEPRIWKILETLREHKNAIFFGTVTDKGLEPYK